MDQTTSTQSVPSSSASLNSEPASFKITHIGVLGQDIGEVLASTQSTKCDIHPEHEWVAVNIDVDGMKCLCCHCVQHNESPCPTINLTQAAPLIRERIIEILTTPLDRQDLATGLVATQSGEQDNKECSVECQDERNLIQVGYLMMSSVEALQYWRQQLCNVCELLQTSTQRVLLTVKSDEDQKILDGDVTNIDRISSIASTLNRSLQCNLEGLITARQGVSKALIECLKILGIDEEAKRGPVTRAACEKIMYKRQLSHEVVSEDIKLLRVLESLRKSLKEGDPLLVELTDRDIETIMSERESIYEALISVYKRLSNVNNATTSGVNAPVRDKTSMVLKGLADEVVCVHGRVVTETTEVGWKTSLITLRTKQREEEEAASLFDRALHELEYEDGARKELTHRTLLTLERALATGNPNALLLRLYLPACMQDKGRDEYLKLIQDKGVRHPLLYYHLAMREGLSIMKCQGNIRYQAESQDLFEEDSTIIQTIRDEINQHRENTRAYIHEAIGAGGTKGLSSAFPRASHYKYECVPYVDQLLEGYMFPEHALWYERKMNSLDTNVEAQPLSLIRAKGLWTAKKYDEAAFTLLEAEEKGMMDDRILGTLVEYLRKYTTYDKKLLGKFNSQLDMTLHYCDVLIQRGSWRGYNQKGLIYSDRFPGDPSDKRKASEVYLEADSVGLATNPMYIGRILHWPDFPNRLNESHPWAELGVDMSGTKQLEYWEKALQVATNHYQCIYAYKGLQRLYLRGMPPIRSDEEKYREYLAKEVAINTMLGWHHR